MARIDESFCCSRCFRYRSLKEFIRTNGNDGECHYCGASHVHVIEIGQLTGMFHNFLDLFVADDAALDTLDWYIQEWEVFNDNRLDEGGRGSLVEDIINANWDDDDALVGEAGVAPFVVPVRGFAKGWFVEFQGIAA
ncbi:MAG TPA: hypothetical protein VIZ32_13350 [Vicinamibacterales bacterium]